MKKNPIIPNEGQEIVVYNMYKDSFSTEVGGGMKSDVKWRRAHIAESIGSYMLIHGGVDEEDEKVLSDSYILDLVTYNWSKADIKTNRSYHLAYHASTVVLTSDKKDHPHVSVYKFPDMPSSKSTIKRVSSN